MVYCIVKFSFSIIHYTIYYMHFYNIDFIFLFTSILGRIFRGLSQFGHHRYVGAILSVK